MIRIAETFTSVQGEGSEHGVPMFFVRLAGCSVAGCPLHPAHGGKCDTDWASKESLSVDEIMLRLPLGIHWMSITGGEPMDQPQAVEALTLAAHRRKMRVNLQTSGTREVPDIFDWLTVSPKGTPMELRQRTGHEMKLIYTGQNFGILRAWTMFTNFHRYYLMPLWDGDGCNAEETAKTVIRCGELGLPWRFSLQAHKYAKAR